jgi:hypothetical protein
MKSKLDLFARGGIFAGIFLAYILILIFGGFDWLIKSGQIFAYVLISFIGMFAAALLQGALLTPATIHEIIRRWKVNKDRKAIISYWIGNAFGAIFFVIWLIFHIQEL